MSFLKVNGKIVMSGGIPVKIPDPLVIQENKNVTPSSTEQIITPDEGYDGMAQVTVAAAAITYEQNDAYGYTMIIG